MTGQAVSSFDPDRFGYVKYRNLALHALTQEDVNIVFHNRVANLKKVYPYIPESLNRVLMHFSKGTNWFYEHTTQLLDDLGEFFKP